MTTAMYPTGEHPYWCDLVPDNCITPTPAYPVHIGRTSHMFAQTAESRISLQLWRSDSVMADGTLPGDPGVLVSMTDPFSQGPAMKVLFSAEELKMLAHLCSQYVWMLEREGRHPIHATVDEILADGPA